MIKIKLIALPAEKITPVKDSLKELDKAITDADFSRADEITEEILLSLKEYTQLELEEEKWQEKISSIKQNSQSVIPEYIMDFDLMSDFFPSTSDAAAVLQIPFQEEV